MNVTYPHCKHCCWDNEHHVETHTTPCWSGCVVGITPEVGGLW